MIGSPGILDLLFQCFVLVLVTQFAVCSEDDTSSFARAMAAQASKATNPSNVLIKRKTFPSTRPQVCLAFLSCCGRTDLLNHTMAAAIRHMEEDEPDSLEYEIAWVDNGSHEEKTRLIRDSFEIEHSLPLRQNTGLAFGDNLLIFNLCRAPYILLMEEDWLYLDELVVPQTEKRKRAIATAIALTESNVVAYDNRKVMGVFLRPETYSSFLKWPHMDIWETKKVNLGGNEVTVDYQVFCADTGFRSGYVWGSYTNGVGLYKRESLMDIGRMYGEPSDSFHSRFVEGNYAFRVALKYCHMAIHLDNDDKCRDIAQPACTAAFHHIGGGRGTQPNTLKGTKCVDDSWYFYGTPMYDKYLKMKQHSGQGTEVCSAEDLAQVVQADAMLKDSEEYRRRVEEENKQAFETERKKREEMKDQARMIRESNPDVLRQTITWMASMSNEEINSFADRMERIADSPHPLRGIWDSHGRLQKSSSERDL